MALGSNRGTAARAGRGPEDPHDGAIAVRRRLAGRGLTRLGRFRRERRVRTATTLGLVVLGPLLAGLTYYVLGPLDQGASSPLLRIVLLIDLVYVLGIAALVAREIARITGKSF